MVQNRSGDLALVTLVYDWPGGRNLNLIQKQTGGGIWDLEWTNGTSFYYNLTVTAPSQASVQIHRYRASACYT